MECNKLWCSARTGNLSDSWSLISYLSFSTMGEVKPTLPRSLSETLHHDVEKWSSVEEVRIESIDHPYIADIKRERRCAKPV